MRKTGVMDIKRLQVTDSSYIEGTICLVNDVNGCHGDGFFERGRTNGAIKLALAGTQDWWRRFPPLLGC